MSDKKIRLQKELAMPDLHKSAAKEATGNAPDHKEAIPKKNMKEGGCVENHMKKGGKAKKEGKK